MRWNYNDAYRDEFEKGVHRDILIVPHATNVEIVPGHAPEITSKVPVLDKTTGAPVTPMEMQPVAFVITNEDIYKEKFEYRYALNSSDDLTFTSCEAAMVKFTIRNNKTYNPEKDRWEWEIPNLQTYVIEDEETHRKVLGEVLAHYIIKVYTYINGDSSTLMYLGMFTVEEDKISSDGYSREITAYDFMATLRDMDIGLWYYHLFAGINKLDDDYADYLKDLEKAQEQGHDKPGAETNKEEGKHDDPANWIKEYEHNPDGSYVIDPETGKPKVARIRDRKSCWTIGEAIKDLFKNLAAFAPETPTVTNDKDLYLSDESPYTGYGMPIMLDPDLFDYTSKYSIPTTTGSDQFEHYGYLEVIEMPFYPDPKIMESKTLSCGKFLEDIGMLSGRYPCIRLDYLHDEDYITPVESNPSTYYSTYEKCILTFKPLPKNDEKIVANNCMDNTDIVKGFKHDLYDVDTIWILEVYNRNNGKDPIMKYANLTKKQKETRKANPDYEYKTFSIVNNTFTDYLATKKEDVPEKVGDDGINYQDNFPFYKGIIELLDQGNKDYQYPENSIHGDKPYIEGDSGSSATKDHALMHPCYANIKYRTYRPYELTTYADPVRDVGDRIHIEFEDRVTGEHDEFDTYILERKLSGIQKMMDTYTSKGSSTSSSFSDYKTNTRYNSNSYSMQTFGYGKSGSGSGGGTNLTGITANDFCEIIRNIGFRLLDEPSGVVANFISANGESEVIVTARLIDSSSYEEFPYEGESDIHNGDTTNPIYVYDDTGEVVPYNVSAGDYFTFDRQGDGTEYPSDTWQPIYLFDGSKWIYTGDYGYGNASGGGTNVYFNNPNNVSATAIIENFADIAADPSINKVVIKPNIGDYTDYFFKYNIENANVASYGALHNFYSSEKVSSTERISTKMEITPRYGDTIIDTTDTYDPRAYWWQYPGFWTITYPSSSEITIKTNPHVELKWTDPVNITTWEPKPCAWEGTIVVRKESSAPLHRWDGVLIADSTTRDAYKDTALIDDTIELNKVYYYGIFPYYTAIQDAEHPIKYYRFTKVVRVSTGKSVDAPEILSIERIS